MSRPRRIALHFGLGLAEIICISIFLVELARARAGNSLSWAYVFEWPILGGYAVYMWRKLLLDEGLKASPEIHNAREEKQLVAYNDYLSRVHASKDPHHDLPRNGSNVTSSKSDG